MQKSKAILFLSVAVCIAVSMSSCLKATDVEKTPAKAYLSIMHLATAGTAPAVDIYFDATKVSSTSWTAGTVPTTYSAVDKGYYSVIFKKASSDSVVAGLSSMQFDSLGFYTVFLYNEPTGEATAAVIEDDFSDLTNDKPYFRFIHASPSTGAVDLYIDDVKSSYNTNRSLADNRFADYLGKFQAASSGYHTIKIKLSGQDSTIASLTDVTLLSNNAYTFYLKGASGGTGANALALGVLRAAN